MPVVAVGALISAALIYEHPSFVQAQSSQPFPAPSTAPWCGGGNSALGVAPRSSRQSENGGVKQPLQGAASGAPTDPVAAADGKHSPPTGQYVLSPITVAGYSTEDVSLSAVMSELPLPLPFCSIRIQYSGAPGSAGGRGWSIFGAIHCSATPTPPV
ncbi:MAG: hypothetical protein ACRD18_00445 [Terriglobia bacterium]